MQIWPSSSRTNLDIDSVKLVYILLKIYSHPTDYLTVALKTRSKFMPIVQMNFFYGHGICRNPYAVCSTGYQSGIPSPYNCGHMHNWFSGCSTGYLVFRTATIRASFGYLKSIVWASRTSLCNDRTVTYECFTSCNPLGIRSYCLCITVNATVPVRL